MIRVDVTAFGELRAMVRALRYIEQDWLKVWTGETRQKIEPMWSAELERSHPNRLQRAVLVRTSRVSVSRRAIMLKAGTVGVIKAPPGNKPGSRGGSKRTPTKAATLARGVEFGQDPTLKSRYVRKDPQVPAPAQHVVTRRSARPLGPRQKSGKVVWPALGRFVPKAAALAAELFYDVLGRVKGLD